MPPGANTGGGSCHGVVVVRGPHCLVQGLGLWPWFWQMGGGRQECLSVYWWSRQDGINGTIQLWDSLNPHAAVKTSADNTTIPYLNQKLVKKTILCFGEKELPD